MSVLVDSIKIFDTKYNFEVLKSYHVENHHLYSVLIPNIQPILVPMIAINVWSSLMSLVKLDFALDLIWIQYFVDVTFLMLAKYLQTFFPLEELKIWVLYICGQICSDRIIKCNFPPCKYFYLHFNLFFGNLHFLQSLLKTIVMISLPILNISRML